MDYDPLDDTLITIPLAGEMLSVGRQAAYKLVRDGVLGPVVNLGKKRKRIRRGDVKAVIRNRSEGGYGQNHRGPKTPRGRNS